jgi:serine/threonine-protein kinase
MTDLFRANSLDQNFDRPTRDLTATQLLDRGAMGIEASLDDAPAAKAAMLKLFGEMYEELGLTEASLRMHDKSVAEAERVFGRDSREYALALLEKAWVTNLVDRRSRVPLDLTREAKAILAARAPDSEDLGEALYMESHMLQMTDANAAVAAGEESLRVMARAGATGKRLAFARQELGGAYRAQGDLDKAATTMRAAIADYERLFGPDYAELGYLNSTLATVLQLQLRLPEAEARFRRAIAIYDKYASHRTRGSALFRTQLAVVLHQRGKHDEGYAMSAEAEAARKDAHDGFSYTVEQVRANRGADRLSQGDADRAIAEMRAAYANRAAFPPRSITPPAAVEEYLARAYLLKGDRAEAAAAAARAQEHATRDGVPPARAVWIALRGAESEALQGRAEPALRMIDDAIARNRLAADNPASALQIALSRARIARAAQRQDDVLVALAPWLEHPLAEGVELPRDTRAEMLLLQGEALAPSDPAKARERLLAAQEILAANDVEDSPRRAEIERALAGLRS